MLLLRHRFLVTCCRSFTKPLQQSRALCFKVMRTGRSGEVADALERRKVKVCCVQETRWKGEGTRMLRNKTERKYKLFWKGCSEGVSGVGVIVSEEFIDKVVEVTRVNERLIVGKCRMNVVAAYAPQTGRSQEEKDNFWEAVWKLIEEIRDRENYVRRGLEWACWQGE